MAITLPTAKPPKKPVNWTALIVIVVSTLVVFGGAYYLFFAPTPGIEVLVPTEQRVTSQLSGLQFNTQTVVEVFNAGRLKRYAAPTSLGATGRVNPFVSF